MKPKNISEFIALIKKYESITQHDIYEIENLYVKGYNDYGQVIASVLTGYGSMYTCTLCKAIDAINEDCLFCVYAPLNNGSMSNAPCSDGQMRSSYKLIYSAENKEQLLEAFKERAKAMRKFAKSYDIPID